MLAPPAVEALLELRSTLTASRERGVRLPLYRALSRVADAQRFALAAAGSRSAWASWAGRRAHPCHLKGVAGAPVHVATSRQIP